MQDHPPGREGWHATTIIMVKKGGRTVIGGDGQVSIGQTIVKGNAKKVRRLAKGEVIGGFAGATADAFTLFERLEAEARAISRPAHARLRGARQGLAHRPLFAQARGHDARRRQGSSARADRHRRRAGAGNHGRRRVMGIGSGGNYALAAGRALLVTDLEAEAIARRSLEIASEICVYTNRNLVLELIASK